MDLPLLYEISARYAFWNRCAVEQLRTVSSRFVSHFLAQNGEGTARSWKNPMHASNQNMIFVNQVASLKFYCLLTLVLHAPLDRRDL